jgi:hypothetical protein
VNPSGSSCWASASTSQKNAARASEFRVPARTCHRDSRINRRQVPDIDASSPL